MINTRIPSHARIALFLLTALLWAGAGAVHQPSVRAASTRVTVAIQAGTDDADSNAFSGANMTATYINLPAWSRGFWRFPVGVPDGSVIESASLNVRADAAWSGSHVAHLRLIDSTDCDDFTSDPYARVTWGDIAWPTPSGTAGNVWHTSADISSLVQHFIDNTGYVAGSHLCLAWYPESGAADRSVWSFDGGYGATLEITYNDGSATPTPTPTTTADSPTPTTTATAIATTMPTGDFYLDSPYVGGTYQYLGQLHTHSKDTGGLEEPAVVEAAYRDAGYDFIALTGQNVIVVNPNVAGILHVSESEEVWQSYGHIAAFDIQTLIPTTYDAQQSIDQIAAQGGVAVLAHPNFSVATWDDAELKNLSGYHAIEIKNGYIIHQEGTGNGTALAEWDMLLSEGRRVWGVGVDDAHSIAEGIFNTYAVRVFSQLATADQEDLSAALKDGNFYTTSGSNGPRVHDVAVSNRDVTVTLQDVSSTYTVSWYGHNGTLLETDTNVDTQAGYTADGTENYIRTEIQRNDDNGRAWTNPIRVVGGNSPTPTSTATATATATATKTSSPGPSPTSTSTATATPTPMATETPAATATPAGTGPYLDEDFAAYSVGTNPLNWLDHTPGFTAGDYYQTQTVDGQMAYGPVSTSSSYSHYDTSGTLNWQNYEITGRLRFGSASDGIALTFYSQMPAGQDRTYMLLRYSGETGFRIHTRGTNISDGITSVNVNAQPNTWYQFRLRVHTGTDRVRIVAKVWQAGQPEPASWQIDCFDGYSSRITAGTVGVWSLGSGTRAIDDLRVRPLDPAPITGFPLGLYDVASGEFGTIQSAALQRVHRYDSTQSQAAAVTYLQAAETAGLDVVQNMPSDYLTYAESFWTGWIDAVAPYDPLAVWYLPEEPTNLTAIKRLHDLIRLRDQASRPAGTYFADLTTLNQWCDSVDIFFVGAYPEYSGQPRASMMARLDIAQEACPNTPIIGVPMFFDTTFDGAGEHPTPHEARADAYTAVIAGVRGLQWFSYHHGQNLPDLWQAVQDIAAEIESLEPVLTAPDSVSPAQVQVLAGPLQSPTVSGRTYDSIQILQKEYLGDTYILAANLATAPVDAEFGGLPIDTGQATVLFENRTLSVTSGAFSDSFVEAGVHVYKVTSGTPAPTPTATDTPLPTNTPTSTPSPSSTATNAPASPTPTNTTTATSTPTAAATQTSAPTNTPTATATATNTSASSTPTNTPIATNTPTPTATQTSTATNTPTATATPIGSEVTFTKHTLIADWTGAIDVASIDMDSDGDLDVVGAAYHEGFIKWWENDGTQGFVEHNVAAVSHGTIDIKPIDLDQDGDVDILATSARGSAPGQDAVLWYENDGTQTFAERVVANNVDYPQWADAGDLDGDGDIDVVATAFDTDEVLWFENDGTQSFTRHLLENDFSIYDKGPYYGDVIDLDRDGDTDIVVVGQGTSNIYWWENAGAGTFTKQTILTGLDQSGSWAVRAGDIDGDSDLDLAVSGFAGLAWYENDGSETFTERIIDPTFSSYYAAPISPADVDGDGDLDLLVGTAGAAGPCCSTADDDVIWWENDGSGTFTSHVIEKIFEVPWNLAGTDLDGDGDTDVLGAADYGYEIVWWENLSGPVATPTATPTPTDTPTATPTVTGTPPTATPTATNTPTSTTTPTAPPSATPTPTSTPGADTLLQEDFDAYASGSDPANWRDQTATLTDSDFYKVETVAGSQALTFTGSGSGWRFSHYDGTGATNWQDYDVSGRLNFATATGSAGITFYSQVPAGQNNWYLLLRYANENQFRMHANGTNISDCTGAMSIPAGITPGTWYWFRVQVETISDRVLIRARVWEEGQVEPSAWPINCYDAYVSRINGGTVGIWTEAFGGRTAIDTVEVKSLSAP